MQIARCDIAISPPIHPEISVAAQVLQNLQEPAKPEAFIDLSRTILESFCRTTSSVSFHELN
jgi:hypothetical protein